MAEGKETTEGTESRVLRIIGFSMLGLALVLALVLGAEQVAEEDATDVPPWWRGPHVAGVITKFDKASLSLKEENGKEEQILTDANTHYTWRGSMMEPAAGVHAIVIYRAGNPKIARTVRMVEAPPTGTSSGSPSASPSGASPGASPSGAAPSESPSGAAPSGSPEASGSPSAQASPSSSASGTP